MVYYKLIHLPRITKEVKLEDDEERDIYSSEYIEELGEDDELSLAEQGFMEGYIEA